MKDLQVGTWNALFPYRSEALPDGTGGVGRPTNRWLESNKKI
jgi:hypothetical protein